MTSELPSVKQVDCAHGGYIQLHKPEPEEIAQGKDDLYVFVGHEGGELADYMVIMTRKQAEVLRGMLGDYLEETRR
jgi:hypothetical protein